MNTVGKKVISINGREELCSIQNLHIRIQEIMDQQWRNLFYVKSDIAADKTVCEVSGNFMSARDADERIAAHYAGKQYVGWKLVREKFQAMIDETPQVADVGWLRGQVSELAEP